MNTTKNISRGCQPADLDHDAHSTAHDTASGDDVVRRFGSAAWDMGSCDGFSCILPGAAEDAEI
jgi:hypothetical protein